MKPSYTTRKLIVPLGKIAAAPTGGGSAELSTADPKDSQATRAQKARATGFNNT